MVNAIYGNMTPFLRHFHDVLDVTSCLLNYSNDQARVSSYVGRSLFCPTVILKSLFVVGPQLKNQDDVMSIIENRISNMVN